jgi:hypothetical protein
VGTGVGAGVGADVGASVSEAGVGAAVAADAGAGEGTEVGAGVGADVGSDVAFVGCCKLETWNSDSPTREVGMSGGTVVPIGTVIVGGTVVSVETESAMQHLKVRVVLRRTQARLRCQPSVHGWLPSSMTGQSSGHTGGMGHSPFGRR